MTVKVVGQVKPVNCVLTRMLVKTLVLSSYVKMGGYAESVQEPPKLLSAHAHQDILMHIVEVPFVMITVHMVCVRYEKEHHIVNVMVDGQAHYVMSASVLVEGQNVIPHANPSNVKIMVHVLLPQEVM